MHCITRVAGGDTAFGLAVTGLCPSISQKDVNCPHGAGPKHCLVHLAVYHQQADGGGADAQASGYCGVLGDIQFEYVGVICL